MKLNFLFLYAIIASAMLTQSCKSTKSSTQSISQEDETVTLADPLKSKIDRFVSVDAVNELRTGMTIDEAIGKLGAKPYNVISAQADGHHILQYKYRLVQIEVPSDDVNNYGLEKKNNKSYFVSRVENVYLMFNGAGKLEYMVSDKGSMSENLLRQNNLLYVIKKDKDKFSADADKGYRSVNSNVFYPLQPCNDCDTKKESKPENEEKNTIKLKLDCGK